ncbi:MAG TPA: tetratricopeptide repeat protein [Thermoanaerobaculia bacterium]|nr:tetratricopeptide repeat protein [Thermoanaerobaculia bacterium]
MPSRLRNILVLIAVLASAVALPLSAQDWKGKGRVQGIVTNDQGQPVEGATVTVRREGKDDGPEPVKTDKKGRWAMGGLATGGWDITVEAAGFTTAAGATKVIEGTQPPEMLRVQLRPAVAQQAAAETQKASAAATAISAGNEFLTQGKYAEARAEYEKALAEIQEAEKKAPVMFGVAQTYAAEGKKKEAIQVLEQSLTYKPGDEKTLRLLVDILVAEGREQDAQKYLAQLPQGTTVDANTLLNIGIKKYNDGDMAGAQSQFDRVVKENPTLPDAYYFRGLTLLAQGKTAEAKADFQKLLEIAPNHEKAAEAKEFLASL